MVCGNFILPEPASYVFFYALFNLRKLLYIIGIRDPVRCANAQRAKTRCADSCKTGRPMAQKNGHQPDTYRIKIGVRFGARGGT